MSYWLVATLAALAAFAGVLLVAPLAAWVAALRLRHHEDALLPAGRLVALRLLPPLAGLAFAAGLVLPAFLLFEPRDAAETPGLALLLLAAIGGHSIVAGLGRAVGDFRATRLLGRLWERQGRSLTLPGSPLPAFAIRHPFPLVSVLGILRPRLFVAEQVLEGLSSSELASVVAHEAGHLASHDNLKRLALRLAPAPPWPGLARRLDATWEEAAEEAADTHAASPLDLASALVKIARLIPPGSRLDLPVAAFQRGDPVARRIRLLTAGRETAPATRSRGAWSYALAVAAAAVFATAACHLAAVHGILEPLVHIL